MGAEASVDIALWSEEHERGARATLDAVRTDDLERALLSIERPTADARQRCQAALEDWAAAAARAGGSLEELSAVLVGEGLVGDQDSYYAVDNSLLSKVVERRRGMPILVAAVWALVGRRAGLTCDGIGLPGHFVVSVQGQLVDAFARGRPLSLSDARQLAAGAAPKSCFDSEWLEPVTTRAWVQRVLANLAGSWYRAGSVVDHYRARRVARVVGDTAPTWRAEAYAAVLLGLPDLARGAWETVVDRWPGSPEAADAARRLTQRAARTLN